MIVTTYGSIELTGIFEQIGFIKPFPDFGGDDVQPVAFEHRPEAIHIDLLHATHGHQGVDDQQHVVLLEML